MNKLLITLFLLSTTIFGQDSMRTFASADYKVKAFLIPNIENDFVARTGTRVRIVLTLLNEGQSRFILNADKFLAATLMIKAREVEFPIHLEKYSQEAALKVKEKTLNTRIKKVTDMAEDKAVIYAKLLFPEFNLTTKTDLLKKLKDDLTALSGLASKAASFDKSHIVEAGAKLSFAASGILPAGNDKPEDSCDLSIRIINSNNKHISIPVSAIFY